MKEIIERVNGAIITVVAIDESTILNEEDKQIGYIDYIDTMGCTTTKRFAFISLNDWTHEKASQVDTIITKLHASLIDRTPIDLVMERRTRKEQTFDYLIKVDNVKAYGQ